jgi:hypothetical protein
MVKIYDFSENELSYKNGTYGGMAGSKDGILINGEEWIVKYPKSLSQMEGENASYSSSPLSEYLGSHIYKILGYNVHDTLLGIRQGKLVVACKDFATDGKMLLEVRTIKNHTGKELEDILEKEKFPSSETHIVDFDELMSHLNRNPILSVIPNIKQHFFEQSVVDVFINNNDRNNGNWGILRERGKKDKIAPIFDNGGSFSTKMPEKKIVRLLENPDKGILENNVLNVLTAYGTKGNQFSAKKFMNYCEQYTEFQTAVLKVTKNIMEKIDDIKSFIDEIPEYCKDKNGKEIEVCSKARKELYKKQIDIRLEKLLIPEMEKITQKV